MAGEIHANADDAALGQAAADRNGTWAVSVAVESVGKDHGRIRPASSLCSRRKVQFAVNHATLCSRKPRDECLDAGVLFGPGCRPTFERRGHEVVGNFFERFIEMIDTLEL